MIKVGLLPMYIKLYDDIWPSVRKQIEPFYEKIKEELEKRGLNVATCGVCRVKSEFIEAVNYFEAACVDAIITLHLAYSPSLESADILSSTRLPLIVLDTTPTFDLSPAQDPVEINFNHGIHGVQDMCNLLLRKGKSFLFEAGHWEKSDVLDRVADDARAAVMSNAIRHARVGIIGRSFPGMGDFIISENTLKKSVGIEIIKYNYISDRKIMDQVTDREIEQEISRDMDLFEPGSIDDKLHRETTKVCLGVRKWIEENKLTGFTANFLDITKDEGFDCMPFLEASKAMTRRIGYAGEGDALTAGLVGMLLSVYPETSFAEMFCPDWKNNAILISHMGEMNLSLSDIKPVLKKKEFPFTDADDTVIAYGRFKGGDCLFVNLSPVRDNKFALIVSPIKMVQVEGADNMQDSIRG